MKNDETDRCSRRVHSINFIKYNSEYHPFNCNNAVQVGPPLESQAVTKRIVAAFSFALNTNLNTTPRQLIAGANGSPLCSHSCVQILCSNHSWWKKIIMGSLSLVRWIFRLGPIFPVLVFLLPSPIYWFKFSRAYIKPEPNQKYKRRASDPITSWCRSSLNPRDACMS